MEWGAGQQEKSYRRHGQARPVGGLTDASTTKARSSPLPSVSLPKSGGAIRGLGEKFSVGVATGTASLAVPLPLSAARMTPQLALAYDSGAGNGPFGFGWSLGGPVRRRQ